MPCRKLRPSVLTSFSDASLPAVDPAAWIDPRALVIGAVTVGRDVFVAPFASIRGDEGAPIFIADRANVQDAVIIHALETNHAGHPVPEHLRTVEGQQYAVYIGPRVSLAHQCHVHGPAVIHADTFIGMQALVFNATVGQGCIIEPAARVIGVEIPQGRYVPAGCTITTPADADACPLITPEYQYANLNQHVVAVNTQLAQSYLRAAQQ